MKLGAVRSAGTAIRWTVTIAALWLIARQLDWPGLLKLLANADVNILALAGLVAVAQFAIMVRRWQIVIELLGCGWIAAGQLAIVLGRSILIGQPLPSTVGGDVVRAVSLAQYIGLSCAARSVLCDRIIALASLLVLGAAILPPLAWRIGYGLTFGMVAAVSIGGLAAFAVVVTIPNIFSWLPWFKRHADVVIVDLQSVFKSGQQGFTVIALGFATHLFGVLLMYTLARALAVPIAILDCVTILTPALLISAIPISLGGWGLREGSIAAGFVMIGLTSESGVATSVLFGLTGPLMGLATELIHPVLRWREQPR